MEVAKRQVVEGCRKNPGTHMGQGADIKVSHAVTLDSLPSSGEKVARGNDGNIDSELHALPFGQGGYGSVVIAYTDEQLPFLIFDTLTGFRHADIFVAEIRHSADNQFRHILLISKHQYFIFKGFRRATDHMDIKGFEQLPRCIEK